MIIRAPEITVAETKITNVMLNLINEQQIRFKMTMDGEPYDFYISNWLGSVKGMGFELAFNGIEVPTKRPVQIQFRMDILKKSVSISGRFLDQEVRISTTFGKAFHDFTKLLKK